MSKNKVYFYLQLQTKFFDEPEIKILLGQPNGAEYVILWQKLLLLAIQSEPVGYVSLQEGIPYDDKMLASITGINIDIVRVGIQLFEKLHLVKILESGEIWIEKSREMVAITTSEALRLRDYRKRQKSLGYEQEVRTYENRTPELELELELEKELNKEREVRAQKELTPPAHPSNPIVKAQKRPKIEFDGSGYTNITPDDLKRWKEAFPAVQLDVELKKSVLWLQTHPKNIKSNYGKFLFNWFSRSQDRAKPIDVERPKVKRTCEYNGCKDEATNRFGSHFYCAWHWYEVSEKQKKGE